MARDVKKPILIIGGGLVGLTLAQALTKACIRCTVYERDPVIETEQGGGWAITIHWALNALRDCLPDDLFDRIAKIQVDPKQGLKDTGRFLFLNLATAQPKYEIPPSKRMRVNRQMLRSVLADGVDVKYGKRLAGFEARAHSTTVVAHFEDGTSASSSLLIACDGTNSRMRQLLFDCGRPDNASLFHIPVRAMGVTIRMTEEQVRPLRQIDPLLFQGCHPDTGVFLWYSTISTPSLNGSDTTDNPYHEGQLIMSWLHRSNKDDVPALGENDARRLKMQEMAKSFEVRLRTAVNQIPCGADIKEIKLQDWPTRTWPTHGGRITLAGDAAHAMTMYRGEAFNHGVTDAANLAKQLIRVESGELSIKKALSEYGAEVVSRTHDAVLLSRQACLDAHDLHSLQPDSPLKAKGAAQREKQADARALLFQGRGNPVPVPPAPSPDVTHVRRMYHASDIKELAAKIRTDATIDVPDITDLEAEQWYAMWQMEQVARASALNRIATRLLGMHERAHYTDMEGTRFQTEEEALVRFGHSRRIQEFVKNMADMLELRSQFGEAGTNLGTGTLDFTVNETYKD